MGDPAEDSEDATSSLGDEERVRRLFQACDGDGDGFIDSHDLLNICRELNLEDSLEDLMRELGADEHGRICYQEFLRRRVALRPEIDALKSTQPAQAEYIPTSSENSLGEGKMSWEFDSGARDLSPEPHSLQQLVSSSPHPASGNLLELANKLHVAALASLKAEILDLSNRLQIAQKERDHFEKALHKADVERHKMEQKMAEEAQLHEEQLTELHSVIAELTRKNMHQRALVIQEEEISETDDNEVSAGVDCSQTLPPDEGGIEEPSDVSSVSPEPEPEEETNDVDDSELAKEYAACKAENSMLQERLKRALQDLETISNLNAKKSPRDAPSGLEIIRTARVASPNVLVDRASPSLVQDRPSSPARLDRGPALPKIAECVRLKKVDDHVTGSDIANFGVCHTKVAEQLVAGVQEDSDLQELSRGDVVTRRQRDLDIERLNQRLEHVRSQNTVLGITLEQCKEQCDRLHLLVGKYESNAIALSLALRSSDAALEVAEALLSLLETELGLVLANCRQPGGEEDHRFLRRAADSRRQAERHARDLLWRPGSQSASDWIPADEGKLRDRLAHLKSERNACKAGVVELESLHVEPLPAPIPESRKLDLETAVLMQELMSMREERVELKARIHLLEKEWSAKELRVATQKAHLQTVLQSMHQLQSQFNEERRGNDDPEHQRRLHKQIDELVVALDGVARGAEVNQQENAALVLDLRVANTALVSTLERCKRKYQGRLKRLESQMASLVERHAQQIKALKQKISSLEGNGLPINRLEETNI